MRFNFSNMYHYIQVWEFSLLLSLLPSFLVLWNVLFTELYHPGRDDFLFTDNMGFSITWVFFFLIAWEHLIFQIELWYKKSKLAPFTYHSELNASSQGEQKIQFSLGSFYEIKSNKLQYRRVTLGSAPADWEYLSSDLTSFTSQMVQRENRKIGREKSNILAPHHVLSTIFFPSL